MAGGEYQDFLDEQARPVYPVCACGEEISTKSWNHCPACGKDIPSSDFNTNPVGMWEVTTEGDCEGRTTKQLGVHEGHIVDIARNLASQTGYGLHFRKLKVSKTLRASPKFNGPIKIGVYPQMSLADISFDTTKRNVSIETIGGPGGFSLTFK